MDWKPAKLQAAIWAATVWCGPICGELHAAAPSAPPEVQGEATTEEGKAFRTALTTWRESAAELRKLVGANSSKEKPEERRARVDTAAHESDAKLDALIEAAKVAYEADPKDRDIETFLGYVTNLIGAFDRLEESLDIALLLAKHGVETTDLFNFIGRSALEVGQFDLAEEYWKKSQALGKLDPDGEKQLAKLEEWRSRVGEETARRQEEARADNNPRIRFNTTRGEFIVELFEDDFPNTINNFVYLVEQAYFTNHPFFRVVSGFGATTGCPAGNGTGGPGHVIANEAASGKNRPHLRGTLAMVTTKEGIHGSQFFIKYRLTGGGLETDMPVFGRVIEGMEVVSRLQRAEPFTKLKQASPDKILEARVIRKRDHEYFPEAVGRGLASVKTALKMSESGDVPGALKLLQEIVEENPDLFEAQYSLGLLQMALGQHREANRYLMKSLELRSNNPDIHFNLGLNFAMQQKLDAAAEEFREAIKLAPTYVQAHNNLATMLVQLGKKDEAERALEEAVRLNPDYKPARENLQKLRAQRKTVDAAKAAAEGKSAAGKPTESNASEGEKKPADKKPQKKPESKSQKRPAEKKPVEKKPTEKKPAEAKKPANSDQPEK